MPVWSSGTVYLVQSKAYDNASNTETPLEGNSFTYDTTSPSSYATYPTNSTILKALATISEQQLIMQQVYPMLKCL